MTIYLDTCVYQDLKKEKYQTLFELLKSDKERNIYCHSEAHLYDLSRDCTDNKFSDMQFMEEISKNHCFYFKEKTRFEYITPFQYYEAFDWSYTGSANDLFSFEDDFAKMLFPLFKAIPLNFKDFVPVNQLPEDMPETYKALLSSTTNFYEFFIGLMEFTDQLTEEQKKFREFIQYLRKNSLTDKIYEQLKIEGYSGSRVTDREKFRNSYANWFIKEGKEKSAYDLFIEMYHGLEIFGLVRGKASKQKMMNLINDGRHAFFAAHCDIVVSSDNDFINKTRFMYLFCEIDTYVVHIDEFADVIASLNRLAELGFVDLLKEVNGDDLKNRVVRIEENEAYRVIYFALKKIYFSYFNLFLQVNNRNGRYSFFTKESDKYLFGTLTKEIEYVTNRLVSELGKDLNGYELFNTKEINEGDWVGRIWNLGETLVELNYVDKIQLVLYPIEYINKLSKDPNKYNK